MTEKKSKDANLELKRALFFQIGLVTALAVVLLIFEWSVYQKHEKILEELDLEDTWEMEPVIAPIKTSSALQKVEKTRAKRTSPSRQIKLVDDFLPPKDWLAQDNLENDDADVNFEDEKVNDDPLPTFIGDTNTYQIGELQVQPAFPGGMEALRRFLSKRLVYPQTAKDSDISGRVYIHFLIDADGKVINAKVRKGIGGGCDREALRVVQAMPSWKPAMQNGHAVRVSINLPIVFRLDNQ